MEFLQKGQSKNIKEILNDTIMILCQNSVSFESQITVEAIIGITVDSSQVLLINIKELVDKNERIKQEPELPQSTDGNFVSEETSWNQMDPYDDGIGNVIQIEDEEAGQDLEFPSDDVFASFSVKSELAKKDDGIANVQLSDFSGQNFANERFFKNASVFMKFNVTCSDFGQPKRTAASLPSGPKNNQRMVSSQQNQARRNRINPNTEMFHCKICAKSFSNRSVYRYHLKQHKLNVGVSKIDADTPHSTGYYKANDWAGEPSSEQSGSISAGEAQTVYTCNICGTMVRHLSSFKRHKELHNGVVFRCQMCGKVFSRRDNMQKHQRACGNFNSEGYQE